VEYYPSPTSDIGGRLTASVQKSDPDTSSAEVSNESLNIGVRLQLLTEFGRGKLRRGPFTGDGGVSLFGLGFNGWWGLARYDFNPGAGGTTSVLRHSWSSELRGWWFVSGGKHTAVNAVSPTVLRGSGPVIDTNQAYAAWLLQPQLRMGFERKWEEAEDSYVVQAVGSNGLQLAEKMKLSPPDAVPKLSITMAVPIEPPQYRFAFGPAVRFSAKGQPGTWDPFSSVGRVRAEFWMYYFAFDSESAVRVGVAPFLDVRAYGTDKREGMVAGGVIELRTSVSRLEY
jgi:hypothetical protein